MPVKLDHPVGNSSAPTPFRTNPIVGLGHLTGPGGPSAVAKRVRAPMHPGNGGSARAFRRRGEAPPGPLPHARAKTRVPRRGFPPGFRQVPAGFPPGFTPGLGFPPGPPPGSPPGFPSGFPPGFPPGFSLGSQPGSPPGFPLGFPPGFPTGSPRAAAGSPAGFPTPMGWVGPACEVSDCNPL